MAQSSHTCQRCHQPLVLDPSIQNLTPSAHSLITSALPSPSTPSTLSADAKLASLPPSSRAGAEVWAGAHAVPFASGSSTNRHGQGSGAVGESFILLSDSILPSSSSHPAGRSHAHAQAQAHERAPSGGSAPSPGIALGPSPHSTLTSNLHQILSSRTPISHPLCTECTTMLQLELQRELEELQRERDGYIEFQRGVVRNREGLGRRLLPGKGMGSGEGGALGEYDIEGTEEEWEGLQRRKRELEREEERLRVALGEAEGELERAKGEEERVKGEEEAMDLEEEEFLLSHAEISTELKKLSETLSSAQTNLLLSQSLLAHLESANVYNDAFQIGHVPLEPAPGGRGPGGVSVGTINGLRLGGRPVVEWEEINAGWGLVALCVDRIAAKVGCVFEGYKILPLGSFSRIEEIPASKGSYELYASSDLSPARLLQNRRFNHALVSLLELIRQLVDFGRKNDRGWGVDNIEIRKDKISGHSIRLPGLSAMQMPTLSSMSIMGLGSSMSTSSSADNQSGGSGGGSRRDTDSSGEETWTRACRAVLAVLKRILVVESEADRSGVSAAAAAAAGVGVGGAAAGAKAGAGAGAGVGIGAGAGGAGRSALGVAAGR